ncbi:hypothetical protein ACHAPU_001954 [Fusarium lateritium]
MSTEILSSLSSRPSGGNINVARSTLANPQQMHQGNPLQNILETPLRSSHHVASARTLSCNWQISNGKPISLENMDFMLGVLQESFPSDVCVQLARLVGVQFSSFNLINGSKRFIAPILDDADQGQWSLVHATYHDEDRQERIPRHITVQYYDPCYSQGRSKVVKEKLNSWIRRDYGEDMGLRFIEVKGPVDPESPDMSGMHIIMAACEFARFAMVKSKSKSWDRDPKTFLKAALQQQTHNSPPRQSNTIELENSQSLTFTRPSPDKRKERQGSSPSISLSTAATTPPTSPVASQSSKTYAVNPEGSGNKTGLSSQQKMVACPNSQHNSQRKAMPTAGTSSASTSAAVYNMIAPEADGLLGESCTEPNSKRRRVEDEHPLLFNFTGKMGEMARSYREVGFPEIDVLQREREKCYDELDGKRKAVRKMEEVLGIYYTQYTLRKLEYGYCDQECKTIQAGIVKAEKAVNGFLSSLPSLSSLEIEVEVTDMDLVQAMSTTLEVNMINPLQDKFRDKLDRKRKVGQMLESSQQACIEYENDIDKARKEEKLIEDKSREACQREEFAAMLDSFAKRSLAFNKAWETVEGKECRHWYEAFCERRAPT